MARKQNQFCMQPNLSHLIGHVGEGNQRMQPGAGTSARRQRLGARGLVGRGFRFLLEALGSQARSILYSGVRILYSDGFFIRLD